MRAFSKKSMSVFRFYREFHPASFNLGEGGSNRDFGADLAGPEMAYVTLVPTV